MVNDHRSKLAQAVMLHTCSWRYKVQILTGIQTTTLKSTLLLSIYGQVVQVVSFLWPSPPKPCMCMSLYMPYDLSNWSFVIWSPKYLVRSVDHDAPYYIIFSGLLLFPPPPGSTLLSNTITLCSSQMWQTKFQTHISTYKRQNYRFVYFTILIQWNAVTKILRTPRKSYFLSGKFLKRVILMKWENFGAFLSWLLRREVS
jgi:hypothetical protein